MVFISILTPVFNGVEFLEQCIRSVRSQTFPDWELWIGVNGHGEDGGMVAQLASQYAASDLRIHVVVQGPPLKGKVESFSNKEIIYIGGQVNPGDPLNAETLSSPRQSIPRELARHILQGNKKEKVIAEQEANKIQKKQKSKLNRNIVWVDQLIELSYNKNRFFSGQNEPLNDEELQNQENNQMKMN